MNNRSIFHIFLTLILLSSCQSNDPERPEDLFGQKLDERKQNFQENAPQETIELYDQSIQRLKELGLSDQALKRGDSVPSFTFTSQGQSLEIKDILENNHVILTFYRGGWCPYCMLQLEEYERHYDDFKELGAELIALAPDMPGEIEKSRSRFDITFLMASDEDHQIARKFGLVFQVEPAIVESYSNAGINLQDFQGNDKNELPLAATYVIHKSGEIVFSFVEADYTLRASPSDIKAIIKGLD